MRTGISLSVTFAHKPQLRALVKDRNASQKHVWRAQIVLLTAEGVGTSAIMRDTGKSKTCVWRWQERFADEGFESLLRDKTRPSRISKLDPSIAERVIALTLPPPGETTHWTGVAKRGGQRQRQLGPAHLARSWAATPSHPPVQAFQGPRIRRQAARRGRPLCRSAGACGRPQHRRKEPNPGARPHPAGLPMERGRAGTMTHDYKRHGTTALFAAINVLDGTVIGRNMQRHRHQEFIRFLNAIEREVPAGKTVHAILDNYAAHKHPVVRQWVAHNPRWTFHFTPTSASCLNAIEGFFASLAKRRLKRGVFRSVADLQATINRFLDNRNAHSKPFEWVADPDNIIAAVKPGHQVLDSMH
jgi:transposase